MNSLGSKSKVPAKKPPDAFKGVPDHLAAEYLLNDKYEVLKRVILLSVCVEDVSCVCIGKNCVVFYLQVQQLKDYLWLNG